MARSPVYPREKLMRHHGVWLTDRQYASLLRISQRDHVAIGHLLREGAMKLIREMDRSPEEATT